MKIDRGPVASRGHRQSPWHTRTCLLSTESTPPRSPPFSSPGASPRHDHSVVPFPTLPRRSRIGLAGVPRVPCDLSRLIAQHSPLSNRGFARVARSSHGHPFLRVSVSPWLPSGRPLAGAECWYCCSTLQALPQASRLEPQAFIAITPVLTVGATAGLSSSAKAMLGRVPASPPLQSPRRSRTWLAPPNATAQT